MILNPKQQAHREYLKTSFYAFIEWAWPLVDPANFIPNWHIARICEYLQAVTEGHIPKLLINIPPGHQKSLTCNVFWQAWDWTRDPQHRFMFTSYRGDLALRDADRCRALIRSKEYQKYFGGTFQLRPGQDTKSRYENDRKGYRYSSAISGIMGEGGDYVVLDDPHNVEQAESDDVRNETVRKINLALPSRVRSKNGGVVCIMQRLHEDDFAGSCIDSGQWTHLCLPARYEYDHPYVSRTITLGSGKVLKGDNRENPKIMRAYQKLAYKKDDKISEAKAKLVANAKNGELLFPALFDEERIALLEEPLGQYGVAGQLQQRPAPREGGLFKMSWFEDNFISQKALPKTRVIVRGYDLAGSTRKESPYTVGVKMSMDAKRNIYIEHVDRYKESPGGVEKNFKARAKLDGKGVYIDIPQDPGQAGKAQVKAYTKLLIGYVCRYSPESGDKVQRAEPFSAQCEAGHVYIVESDWNQAYLDELVIFPGGKFKDQVDASSRAFARLLSLGGTVKTGVSSGSY